MHRVVGMAQAAAINRYTRRNVERRQFPGILALPEFPRGNDLRGALESVHANASDNLPTLCICSFIYQSKAVTPFRGRQKGSNAMQGIQWQRLDSGRFAAAAAAASFARGLLLNSITIFVLLRLRANILRLFATHRRHGGRFVLRLRSLLCCSSLLPSLLRFSHRAVDVSACSHWAAVAWLGNTGLAPRKSLVDVSQQTPNLSQQTPLLRRRKNLLFGSGCLCLPVLPTISFHSTTAGSN